MKAPSRALAPTLVLALLTGAGGACNPGGDAGARAEAAAPTSTPRTGDCPDAATVSETVGIAVRAFPAGTMTQGPSVICAYEATDRSTGTFVSLVIEPASEADKAFDEVRSAARAFLGQGAEADAIDVGERGLAYGASSKSEAVAVAGGRLYRVDVTSTGQAELGDRKAGLVLLLKRVIG